MPRTQTSADVNMLENHQPVVHSYAQQVSSAQRSDFLDSLITNSQDSSVLFKGKIEYFFPKSVQSCQKNK